MVKKKVEEPSVLNPEYLRDPPQENRMNASTFLKQVLPDHYDEQVKFRHLDELSEAEKAEIQRHKSSPEVVEAFERYGVSEETRAAEKVFDWDSLAEEASRQTGMSKKAIMKAMTMDMKSLPLKYIEGILSIFDEDFENWFDAREFDDEYDG